MKTVYIDSTLKHEWNRAFNPRLCAALEERGVECHLPQRDTHQEGDKPGIWRQNTDAIRALPVLLAVSANESPNWGVEVGFAYGLEKRLVALAPRGHDVPLMGLHMFDVVVHADDLDNIGSYVDELVQALTAKA